ncbi:MAG TPA: response regulator [Solirubrobacteraceae bacterium]|nr:response regulator [Solirubrobacteraceae bacterium]
MTDARSADGAGALHDVAGDAPTPASHQSLRPVPIAERRRVLFVDDEPHVLEGLRDALRSHRDRWTMRFVEGGEQALQEIAREPCDVIVSDLRMPSMDGAALLERVRELDPTIVRIVLSGHAELRMMARAAGAAHQLLAKPCETDRLIDVIERACAIRRDIAGVQGDRWSTGASVLPSVPRLYRQLTEALASGEASVHEVAGIVEQDMAMAAKLLALANSAYFGRRRPVSSIAQAVAYIGLEALQALALQAGAFSAFSVDPPIPGFDLVRLQRHCWHVAIVARELASDSTVHGDAFTAGLLHDVGLLVLAADAPGALAEILAGAARERRPLQLVERGLGVVSHAQIGAHLLALWGLPPAVSDAVAEHHQPPSLRGPRSVSAAVHLAEVLVEEAEVAIEPGPVPPSELDPELAAHPDLAARLPGWRRIAAERVGAQLAPTVAHGPAEAW